MTAESEFGKYIKEGKSQDEIIAEIIDERTAKHPDGDRLRITPKGQPTVKDLVKVGDFIRSFGDGGYDSKGIVLQVSEYSVYGLPTFSITYCTPDSVCLKGNYKDDEFMGINELVAQDGRILHLFEANKDEVLMIPEKHYENLKNPFDKLKRTPITLEIKFLLRKDGGIDYDGKAGPYVSNGSPFGGCCPAGSIETVESIVESEKKLLQRSYGRKVIVKTKIRDERVKQTTLTTFLKNK